MDISQYQKLLNILGVQIVSEKFFKELEHKIIE